ncbi:two-component system response regulator [Halioglobus japonicus]|uniref:ANTAR domain-containing response regulator n=1 Tax=Halioglobus japonicus TaxID=930805 RepID=UPI0019C2AFC6|nr:ANTAR domain-containing protein [Halioglobus japonicus]GHD19393.1 two-component system response regulator [Halioglobus japonicus]
MILVDDDRSRATSVESKLRDVGFDVLSVIPTASGLLYQMAQQEPDVVIIALDSPDRDVLESLSIASSHNPRPVVMFSESGDQGFITDAIRAGVTAYQAQDISAERVRAAIDIAVAQFSAFNNLREELDETRRQLEERKLVEKAKGLLMSVHKVDEEEAFSTLRKLAMDKNRTLGEVAKEVIDILERNPIKGQSR